MTFFVPGRSASLWFVFYALWMVNMVIRVLFDFVILLQVLVSRALISSWYVVYECNIQTP